jgi:hypothetical protein
MRVAFLIGDEVLLRDISIDPDAAEQGSSDPDAARMASLSWKPVNS